MTTDTTTDAELARLLNAYTLDALEIGAVMGTEGLRRRGDNGVRACKQTASRATLLAYVAEHYRYMLPNQIVVTHVNLGMLPPPSFEEDDDA